MSINNDWSSMPITVVIYIHPSAPKKRLSVTIFKCAYGLLDRIQLIREAQSGGMIINKFMYTQGRFHATLQQVTEQLSLSTVLY